LLAVLTYRQSRSFEIPVKALPTIVAIALMGCCVTPLLLYGSYQYIATGVATVFHFIYPAVVVVIGLTIFRKKPNWGMIRAVLLCIVGICMFYNPNEPLNWTGCALALASGITYAIYVALLSVFRYKDVSGFKLSFYVSVVCAAIMLMVCLVGGKLTLPTTGMGWLLCILLALVINVGAVVMFQKGTFYIGGERAYVLSKVEPMTGVILGVTVLSEKITVLAGVGAALVIAACIMIAVVDAKQKTHGEKED
jgi:drug/metabolite transporter (DMT)-like permease